MPQIEEEDEEPGRDFVRFVPNISANGAVVTVLIRSLPMALTPLPAQVSFVDHKGKACSI